MKASLSFVMLALATVSLGATVDRRQTWGPNTCPTKEQCAASCEAAGLPLEKERQIQLFRVEVIDPSQRQWQYDIMHITLDGAPPYEPVSYVWDPATRQNRQNLSTGTTARLNDGLKESLLYLSVKCETEYLWIDQICIYQSSTTEQNHQARIMGDIYRKSEGFVLARLRSATH
ncbi:HET-domain-containing protein [Stemphylium lycopersici]|uniref:HET-domain-containing protein n=1 Tax=Stemphylium lycopersici TaxID=183478 RepID=A0A364NBE8_STELY|nr:HET-domain-containing protein [Stemphylium lycopersici]RAR14639.1 HET-domain-containing protein [Stemphylium lycopersici]